MVRICLFSEDQELQSLFRSHLSPSFRLLPGFSEDQIRDSIDDNLCDVVVFDLSSSWRSPRDRSEFCKRIVESRIGSVILASKNQRNALSDLFVLGVDCCCFTRLSIPEIESAIRSAYQSSVNRRNGANSWIRNDGVDECGRMVSSGPVMRAIYEQIRSVADLNVPVLITGESGTGKELIARAIHTLGSRSDQPFVAVSAGAIPETLLESELFGHEKGAFTGTVGQRKGYFEAAGSGTLFLDEIGDVSQRTQVMLLRALQEREFCRLGSSRPVPFKARLVFATNRNIEEMVNRGEFRSDLYYRINVIRIKSPALRERREDIPIIVRSLIKRHSAILSKHVHDIEPNAIRALQVQLWPGNVRELENIVQRAMITTTAKTIRLSDLGLLVSPLNAVRTLPRRAGSGKSTGGGPELQEPDFRDLFDADMLEPELNAESKHVVYINDRGGSSTFMQMLQDYRLMLAESALREHNGNKTLAARSLQISRAYLHRILRNAGIDGLDESFAEAAV